MRAFFIPLFVFILFGGVSFLDTNAQARETGASGLPLPRFVSIGKSAANLRRGPDEGFPLLWQYRARHHPLEVIEEYGAWRLVRARDGTQGWMLGRLLSAKRHVLLANIDSSHALRSTPNHEGGIVAFLQSGVVARLHRCRQHWCEISARHKTERKKGWIEAAQIWGVYEFEAKKFTAPN